MRNNIFKICPFDIWEEAKLVGLFIGYGIDITDGFIHFSTIHQIENTLKHHFKNSSNLVLLSIKPDNLNLKWENSRNNEIFPHLYDTFNTNIVEDIFILEKDNFGNFIIPKKISSEL
tara:strand:- start:412 stop:762 length:351 start_codon:yes stop_codon:yes gene_type:complete